MAETRHNLATLGQRLYGPDLEHLILPMERTTYPDDSSADSYFNSRWQERIGVSHGGIIIGIRLQQDQNILPEILSAIQADKEYTLMQIAANLARATQPQTADKTANTARLLAGLDLTKIKL